LSVSSGVLRQLPAARREAADGTRDARSPVPKAPKGGVPATVLANVPGEGHHPISDAIELSLEGAQHRIDIVNPYIADHAIMSRLLDAADRGVEIRIIAPGNPTPPYPAAAFRHHYRG
jgi:phosphatidylserine/phosphatidylglycerophosphate/cardiolipin synthase-like enzyme